MRHHHQPNGADELYCDRLGRVRIRFHWQETGEAGCWVPVAQRSAGGGMGSQFLPRIGQEVLVQFLENDIDRPIIVGALYNGQGEGGVAPTPGGRRGAESDPAPFEAAHDHANSAQGNIAGGNSPLWHGASCDSAGHRNGAAQWGVRSKEFGGSGYNQLMFDDTDAQGRIQLKSSFAATELNLGHLVHGAANYRASLRGNGAELRTDAYGAVRAGAVVCRVARVPGDVPIVVEAAGMGDYRGECGLGSDHARPGRHGDDCAQRARRGLPGRAVAHCAGAGGAGVCGAEGVARWCTSSHHARVALAVTSGR